MHTLQIRNLPSDVYEKLKKVSEEARRSMTQQVIYYIQKGIDDEIQLALNRDRKIAALKRLDQLKEQHSYDTTKVVEWIREDRDR